MRVLIADQAPAVRSALALALGGHPGIEVVGEAADGAALLEACGSGRPDVVLLDWGLPGNDAGRLARRLRGWRAGVRIVALSVRPDDRAPALRAGADAFVSKADHPDALHTALRTLSERLPRRPAT